MADLQVHLYGKPIGVLVGDDWRRFDFHTTAETFERFPLLSTILSQSIPLQPVPQPKRAARRRNFFSELLPEGDALRALAESARLDTSDTIGLLRRYGRDVPGAVEIFDPDAANEPAEPKLRRLTRAQTRELAENQAAPLGNDPVQGRISLGGVQRKLTLTRKAGHWHQPLGGFPSTHIIKPVSRRYPTIIFDEEYGDRLARRLGLLDYDAHIENFEGLDALVIERYDRDTSSEIPTRIHQEDMNQALGASGNQKYQEHGGVVTLQRIAKLVNDVSGQDVPTLFRQVALSVLIGNLDMHAKNISLLHLPDATARLAPAYDMVPLLHQPTDGRLALKVGGQYAIGSVRIDHLVSEGTSWGLSNARELVQETIEQVSQALDAETPHPGAHPELRDQIRTHIGRLQS